MLKDSDNILDLHKGFSYKIISKQNQIMDDGLLVPSSADGMTCIPGPKDKVYLIRNHELGHVPRLSTFFKRIFPFSSIIFAFFKDHVNEDIFADLASILFMKLLSLSNS